MWKKWREVKTKHKTDTESIQTWEELSIEKQTETHEIIKQQKQKLQNHQPFPRKLRIWHTRLLYVVKNYTLYRHTHTYIYALINDLHAMKPCNLYPLVIVKGEFVPKLYPLFILPSLFLHWTARASVEKSEKALCHLPAGTHTHAHILKIVHSCKGYKTLPDQIWCLIRRRERKNVTSLLHANQQDTGRRRKCGCFFHQFAVRLDYHQAISLSPMNWLRENNGKLAVADELTW